MQIRDQRTSTAAPRPGARQPLLYEINARVWVREVGPQRGAKAATLAQVPDRVLDEIGGLGFDLAWLMGVWQGGEAGQLLARHHAELQAEYRRVLPDLAPEDVLGSPYAVEDYRVSRSLGGPAALAALRRRMAKRGLGLILDFVPNHTARDHDWVFSHPEFYVPGTEELLRQEPQNYFAVLTPKRRRILAHGRDPYFPGWTDTAQLNYRYPGLRAALIKTLLEIAGQCDGVRCDMAMLVLDDVFQRTWGDAARPAEGSAAAGEFWAEAIDAVRRRYPDFLFLAEAYWGLEGELQALGFDYTYDKGLYDHLMHAGAGAVRDHLRGDPEVLARGAHFLENHDEPRAAQLLPPDKHRAAAVICYATPGMRFFHEGQLEGRTAKLPVQLGRRPAEKPHRELRLFYEKLLAALQDPVLRHGRWLLLETRPAWEGNCSSDQFVVQRWEGGRQGSRLAVVNFGPEQAQCYVPLDLPYLRGRRVLLRDLLGEAHYEREGDSLRSPGLYLDLGPYQVHLFEVIPSGGARAAG